MSIEHSSLVSKRLSDWYSSSIRKKIIKVDVFQNPSFPEYSLANGAYFDNSTGLVLNGTSGNFVSTPDSPALSITGDIDIKMQVSLPNWSPAASIFIAKRTASSSQTSYVLWINTGGILTLSWSSDGATLINVPCTVSTGIANGSMRWIRATLDVNNGNSQRVVKFYTSVDGNSWTQLGSTVTTSGVTSIFDSTAVLEFGTQFVGTNSPINATIKRVIIQNAYDTIDNTSNVVFDADFSLASYGVRQFIESSSNATIITINSTTANWQKLWNLPAGATFVKVCCVGGGGGGGSGRKGASLSARSGGGGGGSGGVSFAEFSASLFTSPVTVTVGSGGSGGSSRSTNDQSGQNGSNGNATTFGSFCGAGGGNGGAGGATQGNGGNLAAGLYGASGGTAITSSQTRGSATILVAGGGAGGTYNTSDSLLAATLGTAGLTIGSDVPAVRNFMSGSGGTGSLIGNATAGGNGQNGCGGGGGGASTNNVGDSGAGGNGGAGFCVVVSYRDVDVQEFTASGTWNKPVGDYTMAKIFVVGAGGGGGSGRRGLNPTNAPGGGGGGGGSITLITVPISQLNDTEIVTVGLGGAGGAGITVDSTDGNPGNTGGRSSLGTIAFADGGLGGGAGTSTFGSGSTRNGFSFNGGAGAAGSATSTAGSGAGVNSYTGGGGGAGALLGGTSSQGSGGTGIAAVYTSIITSTASPAIGGSGANGPVVATVPGFYGGNGGGAGRSGITVNSGSGGNGSSKGGGGGAGAGSNNGYNSGAGGNGGNGYVCVVCI